MVEFDRIFIDGGLGMIQEPACNYASVDPVELGDGWWVVQSATSFRDVYHVHENGFEVHRSSGTSLYGRDLWGTFKGSRYCMECGKEFPKEFQGIALLQLSLGRHQ